MRWNLYLVSIAVFAMQLGTNRVSKQGVEQHRRPSVLHGH